MSVTKLLKLQDEDMSSPYDKKILPRLHWALRANRIYAARQRHLPSPLPRSRTSYTGHWTLMVVRKH